MMEINLFEVASELVRKIVFLGSGSVYGALTTTPFKEEDAIQSIQSGALEGYAISKIAGLSLCSIIDKHIINLSFLFFQPMYMDVILFLK